MSALFSPIDFIALVVEDDLKYIHLVKQALAELGRHWQTLCLHKGHQALNLMEGGLQHSIDLVVVELNLPDMNGVAVIRQAHQRWPNTPIIVSTTHCSAGDLLAAIEAGAQGFVDKSNASIKLTAAIESVLKGEYPISASLAQHLFRLVPKTEANLVKSDHKAAIPNPLSPRELEFLRHLHNGYTYSQTSRLMGVSVNTVRTFSRRVFLKLEVNTTVQAINAAHKLGII